MSEHATDREIRHREAIRRDEAADERDRAADERDERAARRDDEAAERDATALRTEPPVGSEVTEESVGRSSSVRRSAAADRSRSRDDREAGALSRMASERDRISAQLDRGMSAREREDADIDALTGAYRRGPGLAAADHDFTRARRRGDRYVVALVRVDGLGSVDDGRGQAAGDRLLVTVASTLRTAVTADQLLIRYSDDEFLCTLGRVDLGEAARRVSTAVGVIAAAAEGASVATGLAELRTGDSLADVVARAETGLASPG